MVTRRTGKTWFEVVVSFNGLDRGGVFSQDADDLGWALQHVESGYLREIPEEEAQARVGGNQGQR